MRDAVIVRQREVMAQEGLDAIVAISPENFAHVTGFVVPSQPLMRWRHAIAVITADGEIRVICVDMEETTVRSHLPGIEPTIWGEFTDRPMEALASVLGELGLGEARIGVEMSYLPAGDHQQLAGILSGARLVAVDAALDRLRQLKTPEEIELLQRLSRISDQAIGDSFRAVGPGSTELEMAAALTDSVYSQGAQQFKLMIVATGPRSELPNVGPTDRVLQPGDVCRVEIFSMIDGYHAGVCRTAVVGHTPPEAKRIWANLVECKYQLLDNIKPGASSRTVHEQFRRRFDELGLPAIAFVGHGIGLHLHEEPYIGPYGDTILEAGMVLGIEPLVYRTGLGFGLQLKDMVAVTPDGCRLLSDRTDTDELFVIN